MDKVSVIIPTYNRFNYLLNAIESVKNQTYKNIEIIIINDGSTQEQYYNYKFNGCTVLNLDENSKNRFGFTCPGYVRTQGMKIASGKYIAFLDDDDYWFPDKLILQINAMKLNNCKMSSTEALTGFGKYDQNIKYPLYNREKHFDYLKNKLNLTDDFPDIWDYNFLSIHNTAICSSVILEKDILEKINYMPYYRIGLEDYDCWLNALKHTNLIYIKIPCVYYDAGHADGQNY